MKHNISELQGVTNLLKRTGSQGLHYLSVMFLIHYKQQIQLYGISLTYLKMAHKWHHVLNFLDSLKESFTQESVGLYQLGCMDYFDSLQYILWCGNQTKLVVFDSLNRTE